MYLNRRFLVGCFKGMLPASNPTHATLPVSAAACQQVRYIQKHWKPEFKKLRKQKFVKIELPDYDEKRRDDKMSAEEMRSKMKEKGIMPPRPWIERPINISCTASVFEPFIPPEGDGKISLVTMPGAKQRFEVLEKKGKSMIAVRKIRKFDEDFNPKSFADSAQELYIDAHKTLMGKIKDVEVQDKLHDILTEKCYPEMTTGLLDKTLRWNFIETLELPRAVHVRCTDVISKENVYAQITVRMHTRQTLAIYDRFGRLMYGNEAVAKDTLEYVVFEKHLSNLYGTWRIHGKIIPSWLPLQDVFEKTFVKLTPMPAESDSNIQSSSAEVK